MSPVLVRFAFLIIQLELCVDCREPDIVKLHFNTLIHLTIAIDNENDYYPYFQ